MKKSILSASIAAMIGGLGLVGMAQAGVHMDAANPDLPVAVGNLATAATAATTMSINEAGVGHILLVPYFTTQGTNATLLNITNTDATNGTDSDVETASGSLVISSVTPAGGNLTALTDRKSVV